MAKAAQPALATDEILFELERFELVDRRLTLSGRWFGVRGRRFVRPTLTPLRGRDVSRVLADLEHKPWATEDGEPWEAAFPWDRTGAGAKFELSVAPDIIIRLPPPSAKLALPRRFPALPREPSIAASWRAPQVEEPAPPPPAEITPSHDDVQDSQLAAASAQLEAATAELGAAAAELGATKAELDATKSHLAELEAQLILARNQLSTANNDVTTENAQLKEAYAGLKAAFDELARERDEATAELAARERAAGELRSELERTAAAMEEAARERDEAIRAHGAAMVMRRATRAAPYPSGTRASWRVALALVLLAAVAVAVLIVAHVL